MALRRRPAKVVCSALNTGDLETDEEARSAIESVAAETGLPTDDPIRFGGRFLLDAVLERL